MKRNAIETIFGAVVLIIATIFLVFAYSSSNVKTVDGYQLIAKFSNINGIGVGSDVTIGGFKVGSVIDLEIEDDFFVKTTLNITETLRGKIPEDTIAMISSPGIMSDKVIALEIGFDDYFLGEGDEITQTKAGVSLEQMIGQVVYSIKGNKEENESN